MSEQVVAGWHYNPWLLDMELGEPPRRKNMFVEPRYVLEVWKTARDTERTVEMTWLSLEFNEERGRDFPTERHASGLAVMEVVEPDSESLPTGWAYLLAPTALTAIRVSADVIADIRIEL